MAGRTLPRLIVLTPGDLEPEDLPRALGALQAACEAGCPGVLVREPRLEDRQLLSFAQALRERGGDALWLGVHDRAHLVAACGADALHLGFRSLAPEVARGLLADDVALGASTHAGDDLGGLAALDYLFHGPLHETGSHARGTPGWRAPIGVEGLARATRASVRPVFALGGVAPEHVSAARSAGAFGVAVRSGVARDPRGATRAYLAALAEVTT